MIKRIIFDLGGVYFKGGTRKIYPVLVKKFSEIKPEKIMEILLGELGGNYRRGLLTKKEFWKKAKKTAGVKFNTKEFISIWNSSYTVNKEVKEVVKELSLKHHLVILSGNIRERIRYLENKYGFKKYFKTRLFSYNLKLRKREEGTYKLVLKRLKKKPEECVLIDNSKRNIKLANRAGMKTILYSNPKQLRNDLRKLGI